MHVDSEAGIGGGGQRGDDGGGGGGGRRGMGRGISTRVVTD